MLWKSARRLVSGVCFKTRFVKGPEVRFLWLLLFRLGKLGRAFRRAIGHSEARAEMFREQQDGCLVLFAVLLGQVFDGFHQHPLAVKIPWIGLARFSRRRVGSGIADMVKTLAMQSSRSPKDFEMHGQTVSLRRERRFLNQLPDTPGAWPFSATPPVNP